MNEKDLLKLKDRIDEAKTESAELQGKLKHLMGDLSKTWGCASMEEAEGLLEKMGQDLKEIDQKISEGLAEIEEKYDV